MAGWTAQKNHGCGLGEVAFVCAVRRSKTFLKLLKGFKPFKPFKGLRPGKRQAWTPIRSHWCGLGVPVGCGSRHAKTMFKRLRGLKRVTPGEWHAGPPRRSHWCGLCLTAKKPLMWLWGFCVRGWACNALTRKGCWRQTACWSKLPRSIPHLRWSQAPPLPWRRPGSAD